MTDQTTTDTGASGSSDPLDRVAITTNVWRKAVAARVELADRDRAIVAAFDTGRTGTEIAAASGLDLAEVYRVHRRADQIKSDDDLERRMAETSRRLNALDAAAKEIATAEGPE